MSGELVTIRLVGPSEATLVPSAVFVGALYASYKKAVEGARSDFTRKCEIATLDKMGMIVARLRAAGFGVDVSEDVLKRLDDLEGEKWIDREGARRRVAIVDAEIRKRTNGKHSLYTFQSFGAEWLATRYGAVLADDMGLGKTLQAIAALPPGVGAVIVCPAIVKSVWAGEFRKWRPGVRVTVLSGRGSFRWPEPGEIVVLNYDILPANPEEAPPRIIVIADEGQALKSPDAQRTTRFRKVSKRARANEGRVWILTATPLESRPDDLWTVLDAADLAREAFGTHDDYVKIHFQGSITTKGVRWGLPTADVADRLRRVMLRRLKVDVLHELPAKRHQWVDVDISKKALAECDGILKELGGLEKLETIIRDQKIGFDKMVKARAALATAKIPALLDLVATYEEANEPIVVFSAHRSPIDTLGKREGWRVITGDTKDTDRAEAQALFQEGKLRGVACTIQAGGTGITLTRAAFSIFVDRAWSPGANVQAEDRICRIGQTRGTLIIILEAKHPLDARVAQILAEKSATITASVDAARAEG